MVPQAGTYTGQGFLNAFWEKKPGGLSLEQFRRFNGPTALLAEVEPSCSIAVSGDRCGVALWISHFAGESLTQAQLTWSLKTDTESLAMGSLQPFDAAPGDVRRLGYCPFTVPELDKPVHAVFEAVLDGTGLSNSWDFWFFPKRAPIEGSGLAATEDLVPVLAERYPGIAKAGTPEAASADVVLGSWDHPGLLEACRNGKRGIMLGPADGEPNIKLGWWSLGDQIGTAFADHAVFGDFPHDGSLTPLWFRLIKRGLPLPIDSKYGRFTHFAVGEGRNEYFSYLFQKTGQSEESLLITRGLDLLTDTPEGTRLLDQMVAYVRSPAFVAKTPD